MHKNTYHSLRVGPGVVLKNSCLGYTVSIRSANIRSAVSDHPVTKCLNYVKGLVHNLYICHEIALPYACLKQYRCNIIF